MSRAKPLLLALAGGAVLIVLFLVLRPDDDSEPEARTVTQPTTETATAPTETQPRERPRPRRPRVETIRIAFRGGNVIGERRGAEIERGRRVRLVVTADVSDRVHLHGYDLIRDVAPGRPARIRFRATIVGRFEVELEDRGLQIAQIEVRP